MQKPKALFRTGLIAVLVFSIILCSFTTGLVRQGALATPFQTLPPVNATLATPIGAVTPVPTPLPTLGPGQYFSEINPNRPKVAYIEKGDENFGYGPIQGKSDMYLLWITDGNRTHYLVIPHDDDRLLGTIDPKTDQRQDNGFNEYFENRDSIVKDMTKKHDEILAEERNRNTDVSVGLILSGVGIGVCTFVSAGICGVAVAIFVPASITFFGMGATDETDRRNNMESMTTLEEELADVENQLTGKFEVAKIELSNP